MNLSMSSSSFEMPGTVLVIAKLNKSIFFYQKVVSKNVIRIEVSTTSAKDSNDWIIAKIDLSDSRRSSLT